MGNQDQWSVETAINVGKINNMTIIGGSGTYLTTSITKYKGMVVISYDTSGGLTQWHLYAWDDVNITWVDVTNPIHKHSSSTDGGELFEIEVENPNIFRFNDIAPLKARWQGQVVSGTGAAIADDTAVPDEKLSTGTTTTGYATLFQGGIPIDFAARCRWEGTWMLSAITNILFRWGLGTEDPNASSNNNHKIGIEWCDSQATSDYYTLSANGSSRSLVDSGVALAASVEHGCKIVFYPASKGEYKFWNGTVYNKTGVLPSGVIDRTNIVRWGAKNNNGGSANRDLTVRGTFATGKNNLTGWPV
jgi:hypothetical protein